MEKAITGQCPETPYDYRMYDRIWQRVSPDLDPYPEVRAAAAETAAAPVTSAGVPTDTPAVPVPAETPTVPGVGETQLPGAERNPCCMGTEARESLLVLEGFIESESGDRRCCLALARRVRSPSITRLLRRFAAEKQSAARELTAAYYLITGTCYTPAVTVEPLRWESPAAALRSCYHQEACGGFNYQRAASGTTDECLQKLFTRLSEQSFRRADEVMTLLGQMLHCNSGNPGNPGACWR